MSKQTVIVGIDALRANLKVYEKNMTDAVAEGMRKFGGEIIRQSVDNTPVLTGELRSRSFNEGPLLDGHEYVQVVGYEKFSEPGNYNVEGLWGTENREARGKRYAAAVHELHPTKAKFLEKAYMANVNNFIPYLKKILGDVDIK